jgi:hypothetical protein
MTVPEYLFASSRRKLMHALFVEKLEGSVSELAKRTDVNFSSAHGELAKLRALGLVHTSRWRGALVYRPNLKATAVSALVKLLTAAEQESGRKENPVDQEVLKGLAALGAPLGVKGSMRRSAEEMLALSLTEARKSPLVAKVLPFVLAFNATKLELQQLKELALQQNQRKTLGLMCELAGTLGGRPELKALARELQDRRVRNSEPFFPARTGKFHDRAVRRNTPALARKWKFTMNLGMDAFESVFKKHGDA